MVNITEASQLWDIAQARVCEVIVGILCGGMMMMILPSSSDATALLTALKTCTPDCWNMPVYSGSLKQPMPFVQHMRVIGQILTMNLLRIQAFWSHYRFRQQNARLNALLHQQLRMTSVISSLRRMLLNWPSPPCATREILEQLLTALASSQTDVSPSHVLSPRYARPTSPTTGTSPSGSDYVIFAAFICKVVRNYIVCKAVWMIIPDSHGHPAWLVIPITPKLCGADCVHFVR